MYSDVIREKLIDQYCQVVDLIADINDTTTEEFLETVNTLLEDITSDLIDFGVDPNEMADLYASYTQQAMPYGRA